MSTLFCPTSVKSEECHAIEGWSAKSSFQVIKEERDGHYICSISGYIGKDPLISDEGAWNCRLESSSYQHDQEYFDVVLLRPAKVSTTIDHKVERADRGSNAEMFVTDVAEISCTAEDALPKPKIQWLLNNNIIDFNSNVFSDRFRLIESEGPSQRQQDSWYQVQKISYIADSRDNDKVLQCQVEQVDDQGDIARQSNGNAKYTLFIKVTLTPRPAGWSQHIFTVSEHPRSTAFGRDGDRFHLWRHHYSNPGTLVARFCLAHQTMVLCLPETDSGQDGHGGGRSWRVRRGQWGVHAVTSS